MTNNANTENNKYILQGMLFELGNLLDSAKNLQTQICNVLNSMNSEGSHKKKMSIKKIPIYKDERKSIPKKKFPTFGKKNHNIDYSTDDESFSETDTNSNELVIDESLETVDPSDNIIKIKSETLNNKYYDVNYMMGTCTCPSFIYSNRKICKHMKSIIEKANQYELSNEEINNMKQKANSRN